MRVMTCAGGAPWEPDLVRGLQRRELGVEVARRCVDRGELVGLALRDRPAAVILAAELPWLDRELVGTLHDAGVRVLAVVLEAAHRPLDRLGISLVFDAPPPADEVAALLHRLSVGVEGERAAGRAEPPPDPERPGGALVAVWGGPGAPGRTTVAVHVAFEAARRGRAVVLVDGDVWAPAVAPLLGADELPGLPKAAQQCAGGAADPLDGCLQGLPGGLRLLAGLARADLWPEVPERSWRGVLDAARAAADVVVVDVASPVEEDEELAFDRAPYRRNALTRLAVQDATTILLVARADPVGLRGAVHAHQQLLGTLAGADRRLEVVLNRVPASPRRIQECSRRVEEWTGHAPAAVLPTEPALERCVWEARPLHDLVPRSGWLRELRASFGRLCPVAAR